MAEETPLVKHIADNIENKRRQNFDELIDNIHAMEYQYWGSLLTLEALLIAAFSFIGFRNDPRSNALVALIALAVISCLISAVLIISNFYSRLKTYREQLELYAPVKPPIKTKEQFERHKAEVDAYMPKEKRQLENREQRVVISLYLLAFQGIVIVTLLFFESGLSQRIAELF